MGRKRYFEQNIDQQQPDNSANNSRNNYKHQSNHFHRNANHQPIQNFRGRGRGSGRGGGRGTNNSFRGNQDFGRPHTFERRPYQGEYQGEESLLGNYQGHAGPSRPHRGQARGHIDGHKPWYRYGYGEHRYGVMTNSNPPPSAPQSRMSEEELQYVQKNRKAIQNKIDEAKKDINNKIQVRSKVQELKDKLSMRRRNQSDSSPNPTEEVNDYEEVDEEDVVEEQETPRQETLAANMRFREPQMELFDIEMSNRDFRDVGSGQIPTSPEEDSSDSVIPIRNASFRRSRSEDPSPAAPKRIANQLTSRPKPKKRRVEVTIEREEGELDEEQNVQNIPAEEDSNKMQERREEFDRVAEKLKGAIRQKDKSWLDNLVHANSSNASKRILLTKLMEENHQHISRELAAIRFSGRCLNVQENNGNNETQPIDLIDNMEETVDFKDLPDDLFVQIEDFIKKEMQVDDQSEDEIEEVPVPPKPPVPLVTLDENDDDADEEIPEKPDPIESLKRIVSEEKDLYKELQDLEEQRESVLQRIFHLQELRCEILDC